MNTEELFDDIEAAFYDIITECRNADYIGAEKKAIQNIWQIAREQQKILKNRNDKDDYLKSSSCNKIYPTLNPTEMPDEAIDFMVERGSKVGEIIIMSGLSPMHVDLRSTGVRWLKFHGKLVSDTEYIDPITRKATLGPTVTLWKGDKSGT